MTSKLFCLLILQNWLNFVCFLLRSQHCWVRTPIKYVSLIFLLAKIFVLFFFDDDFEKLVCFFSSLSNWFIFVFANGNFFRGFIYFTLFFWWNSFWNCVWDFGRILFSISFSPPILIRFWNWIAFNKTLGVKVQIFEKKINIIRKFDIEIFSN